MEHSWRARVSTLFFIEYDLSTNSPVFASLVISTSIAPVTPSPSSAISMSLFSSSFLVERSTLSTAVQVSVSLSNPLPSVSRPSASRPSVPRPSVLLSKPIPLLSSSAQEMQYPLTLSFDAKLYSTISPNISITTNGLLALTTTPFFENAYIDTPAPLPSYMLSPGTIALAWQYMYSTNDTISGIYYQIDNNNNHLSVESILYDSTGHQVHFIVTYSTSAAGVWNVYYFSDNPRSPSGYRIGIQGENAISTDLLPPASGILDDAWLESSDSIAKGRLLRFNTTTENGTLTSTTFAARCFGPGTFPMGTCGSPAM